MLVKRLLLLFIEISVFAIGYSNIVETISHVPTPKLHNIGQDEELKAINLYMHAENSMLTNEGIFKSNSNCFDAVIPNGIMYHCDSSIHIDARREVIDVVCSKHDLDENTSEMISNMMRKIEQERIALHIHHCAGEILNMILERSLGLIFDLYIDCGEENVTLKDLPLNETTQFEELTIFCSQWSYLPGSLFFGKMLALETLTVSNTKIKNFEEGALSNLSRLWHLNLIRNRIETLKASDFSDLKSLKHLKIEEPNLHNIGSDIFRSTPHLQRLFIVESKISELPGSFQELKFINTLEISNSFIQSIQESECVNLKNLRSLRIVNNSHLDLDPNCFQYLTEAEEIEILGNNLTALPENKIRFQRLWIIQIGDNGQKISKVSNFVSSPRLENVLLRGLSIREIHPSFFLDPALSEMYSIDMSNNYLTSIPTLPKHVSRLILSNNYLESLGNASLQDVTSLYLDGNKFRDKYLLNGTFEKLTTLRLDGNAMTEVPELDTPNLQVLNLSNNGIVDGLLHYFEKCKNLEELDLSRNSISYFIDMYTIIDLTKLKTLDVSFNPLRSFYYMGTFNLNIRRLDLSGSGLKDISLGWVHFSKQLEELYLRRNCISVIDIDSYFTLGEGFTSLKILDLSHNSISSSYWFQIYDWERKTSGRISVFLNFLNLEELYLAYNDITEIPMDIRNMMPKLRILDLRYNKIKHLSYHELLFTSSYIFHNGTVMPYGRCEALTVDLRHNLIHTVDLQQKMLIKNITQKCEKHRYSHATVLLDDNPILCDCDIFSLLRLIEGDVILASELWRENKKDWVLQAKIVPGNLSCSMPKSVKGKKIAETETWVHHLVPALGFCYTMGYLH